MPTEEELREFYETAFYKEDWARAIGHPERHYFEKRTAEDLRNYVPLLEGLEQHALPGRLLDVGCGDGSLLRVASSRGWRVEGIEPSLEAVAFCRKAGFQVRQEFPGEDTAIEAAYDAATSIVTIEHMRDPRALVRFARRALRPGGVFLVTTMNVDSEEARREGASWHNYAPPGHLVYFSRGSFARLVREEEFEILVQETNPTVLRFAPPSCGFWGALRRTLPWRDPIRRVYHRVREGLAAVSRREGPDLILYARKPAAAAE
jgi:SAM-dependent methyltransferase